MHHLWLIKYDTRIITNMLGLNNCVLGPSRHVRAYYRMPLFSPDFLFSDPFGHETFRLLLRCLPLAGVDTESSAIVQKISHPLFFLPPHAARAPTKSPNIAHFGSLVSSMRATNPANSIRLLRIIASVLSLPAFMNVSRHEIRWSIDLSPTDAASQEVVVGSAQCATMARARASRDAAVQYCFEYLSS